MKKIVLIGAGGHCKVIIDIINYNKEFEIVGIVDKENNKKEKILGIPVIGTDFILKDLYNKGVEYAFICLGALNNMSLRDKIMNNLKKIGFKFPVLIHGDATVSKYSYIGEGTCVMAKAVINAGAQIGINSIINTCAIIEHDCNIGRNCHISPNCVLGGEVNIGRCTHIGIGSTIINGINMGENITIGAGSVVVKDIKQNNILAFGNPAKFVRYK